MDLIESFNLTDPCIEVYFTRRHYQDIKKNRFPYNYELNIDVYTYDITSTDITYILLHAYTDWLETCFNFDSTLQEPQSNTLKKLDLEEIKGLRSSDLILSHSRTIRNLLVQNLGEEKYRLYCSIHLKNVESKCMDLSKILNLTYLDPELEHLTRDLICNLNIDYVVK